MTLYELCQRDIVNITTGVNLGRVDDIVFDASSASITNLVLYGRLKLFGLFGREEDTYIPWADIKTIGSDVVLVQTNVSPAPKAKRTLFSF